jgi:hypothetical protein
VNISDGCGTAREPPAVKRSHFELVANPNQVVDLYPDPIVNSNPELVENPTLEPVVNPNTVANLNPF